MARLSLEEQIRAWREGKITAVERSSRLRPTEQRPCFITSVLCRTAPTGRLRKPGCTRTRMASFTARPQTEGAATVPEDFFRAAEPCSSCLERGKRYCIPSAGQHRTGHSRNPL